MRQERRTAGLDSSLAVDPAQERSASSVQSLLRALDLLEALGRLGDSRLGELADEVGLHPSTAHRLLGTLCARGFVTQDGRSGRYRLGYAVLALAQDTGKHTGELRMIARPHLDAIRDACGETSTWSCWSGGAPSASSRLKARAGCG